MIKVSRCLDDRVTLRGLGFIRIGRPSSFIFKLQFSDVEHPFRPVIDKGHSPFLSSQRDVEDLKLSYHSLEKKAVRPTDSYYEDVVWFNDMPHFAIFSASYLKESQLMNVQRSLGHATPAKFLSSYSLLTLLRPSWKCEKRLKSQSNTARYAISSLDHLSGFYFLLVAKIRAILTTTW